MHSRWTEKPPHSFLSSFLIFLANVPAPAAGAWSPADEACALAIASTQARFAEHPQGVPAALVSGEVSNLLAACGAPSVETSASFASADINPCTIAPATCGDVSVPPLPPTPCLTCLPPIPCVGCLVPPVGVPPVTVPCAMCIVPVVQPEPCSGGTNTVMGWSNYVRVAGVPYRLANTPASSDTQITVVYNKDGSQTAFGGVSKTNSALDRVESIWYSGLAAHTWEFGPALMLGSISVTVRCQPVLLMADQVLDVSISATGSPLGLTRAVLEVTSTGKTCLMPC